MNTPSEARITHHSCDGGKVGGFSQTLDTIMRSIDRWHAEESFKVFVTDLLGYQDDDGTALDRIAVWWTNAFNDGRTHNSDNITHQIADGPRGYLKEGTCIEIGGQPHNRLLCTLVNGCGVTEPGGGPELRFGAPSLAAGEFDQIKAARA